jgi:hypothetical protein
MLAEGMTSCRLVKTQGRFGELDEYVKLDVTETERDSENWIKLAQG